jgi:hypothetical protein
MPTNAGGRPRFIANSCGRCCLPGQQVVHLQQVEARHAPVRREASICAVPAAPEPIHTFSAANTGAPAPAGQPWPMTGCDEPYIGDESISRPPPAKKARMTSVQASRATVGHGRR